MTDGLFDLAPTSCTHCGRPLVNGGCGWCEKEQGQLKALTSVSPTWYDAAERWIMRQPKGTRFTSEQLTTCIGKPSPTAMHANNAVGAFISGQSRLKRIKPVGYTTSTHPGSHSAVIREWVKL